ncbi:MAG: diaminopropionate ammonia-lyase [Gudongella sp.]|nr:diaminopropionate ammonia-lyase [Gudongella sp.]
MIKAYIKEIRKNFKDGASFDYLSQENIEHAIEFHRCFNEYKPTPLVKLLNLSENLGISSIYVKDESFRFGLNAFKVLGGSYAIGMYLAEKLEKHIEDIDFNYLSSDKVKKRLGEITFVTATDGNHGRGVAWAAKRLGHKCVVYMPKGSSKTRLSNIKAEGAEAFIIDGNYDDAVRLSDEMSKKRGWVVIQDTAWVGYEKIPTWIMQGYGTIMKEIMIQIKEKPSHVFLQAGVGSFAAAMIGCLLSEYDDDYPLIYIIEPEKADCIYRSIVAGKIEKVDGDMNTIMAGLACGEPNTISWDIIRDYSDGALSCSDEVTALGMRILGNPIKDDVKIISGESGALGMGILYSVMKKKEFEEIKEKLKLDEDSSVLIISTEGDTDPENYRDLVWCVEKG